MHINYIQRKKEREIPTLHLGDFLSTRFMDNAFEYI